MVLELFVRCRSTRDVTRLVVQHLILRLHTRHEGILRQIIVSTAILLISTLDLFIEGLNIGREKAMQFESGALFARKSGAFVELW